MGDSLPSSNVVCLIKRDGHLEPVSMMCISVQIDIVNTVYIMFSYLIGCVDSIWNVQNFRKRSRGTVDSKRMFTKSF